MGVVEALIMMAVVVVAGAVGHAGISNEEAV